METPPSDTLAMVAAPVEERCQEQQQACVRDVTAEEAGVFALETPANPLLSSTVSSPTLSVLKTRPLKLTQSQPQLHIIQPLRLTRILDEIRRDCASLLARLNH